MSQKNNGEILGIRPDLVNAFGVCSKTPGDVHHFTLSESQTLHAIYRGYLNRAGYGDTPEMNGQK